MTQSKVKVHLESQRDSWRSFQTAVSLHSHTLHSRETLSFVAKLGRRFPLLRAAVQRGNAHYRRAHHSDLDLNRAWWTPPASPRDAWLLERNQIQEHFNLRPFVSLSDHDDIEAPLSLHVLDECRDVPVSVEWSVPFGPTFFHIGIHNLKAETARSVMRDLAAYTADPREQRLGPLLEYVARDPETLIIFNHPSWDESGIGQPNHVECAIQFTRTYSAFIHALELNGLRPWQENRHTFQMARALEKPVISGGDRHAFEPNTILDLTNAATFPEFVEQVRSGRTDVLLTKQYCEPFFLRVLQTIDEIMQDYDNHARGWRRWSDRVFYACDDGIERSLTTLFSNHVPGAVQLFVRCMGVLQHPRVRHTFRFAFPRNEELVL